MPQPSMRAVASAAGSSRSFTLPVDEVLAKGSRALVKRASATTAVTLQRTRVTTAVAALTFTALFWFLQIGPRAFVGDEPTSQAFSDTTRNLGFSALILLAASLPLGLVVGRRLVHGRRAAILYAAHRTLSLTGLAVIGLHLLTPARCHLPGTKPRASCHPVRMAAPDTRHRTRGRRHLDPDRARPFVLRPPALQRPPLEGRAQADRDRTASRARTLTRRRVSLAAPDRRERFRTHDRKRAPDSPGSRGRTASTFDRGDGHRVNRRRLLPELRSN